MEGSSSHGGFRGRGNSARGGFRGRGRGGFVYVKKSQKRSEHVHALKLNYWKKVLPEFRAAENTQVNATGQLDTNESAAPVAGTKRPREKDDASPGDAVSSGTDLTPDEQSTAVEKASRVLQSPGSLRGRTSSIRGKIHRGDTHMLQGHNRFSGALARADAAAAQAQLKAEELAAKRARIEERSAQRAEAARKYAQRTDRGQPVMRHRLQDLLGRIERQVKH